MKDPLFDIKEEIPGTKYHVPTFKVTNDGIVDGDGVVINFCKGNKDNDMAYRQEGMFTVSLIETARQYLESVNKEELASRETSIAITKLQEAIMWLEKRSNDRRRRGVEATYKK